MAQKDHLSQAVECSLLRESLEAERRAHAVTTERLSRLERTWSWRLTGFLRHMGRWMRGVIGRALPPKPAQKRDKRGWLRSAVQRVVVVDKQPLAPHRDGGSQRMWNLLTFLVGLGYEVGIVFDDDEEEIGCREELDALGVRSLGFVGSPKIFWKYHGPAATLVILSRAVVAARHLQAVRTYAPGARVVFDTVDVAFLRFARQHTVTGKLPWVVDLEKARAMECAAAAAADAVWVVSSVEAELLKEAGVTRDIRIVSNIHELQDSPRQPPPGQDVLFVGSFRHEPNVDAADWLVHDLWPRIRRALPSARLLIAGESPPSWLLSAGEQVAVLGHIENLWSLRALVRVNVAPIRYGAGVKNKVSASLSGGIPVVGTAIAAEGMPVRDEEHMLIRDEPQAFADAVVRLLTDDALWLRIARSGLRLAEREYSFAAGAASLLEALRSLGIERSPLPAQATGEKVCAVIPTAGRNPDMLGRCLQSLRRASRNVAVRTIVVHCPAQPEDTAALRTQVDIPDVEFLSLPGPFGYPRSLNEGLKHLGDAQAVLFLNDDCFLDGEDTLYELCRTMRARRWAAVGPWILQLQPNEVALGPDRTAGDFGLTVPIPGMCVLWDVSWIRRTGSFDEEFGRGYGMDEADYFLRALRLGASWGRDDRIVALHENHATFTSALASLRSPEHRRNLDLWKCKHPGIGTWGGSGWEKPT